VQVLLKVRECSCIDTRVARQVVRHRSLTFNVVCQTWKDRRGGVQRRGVLSQAADTSWDGDEWMVDQLRDGARNAPSIPATITRTQACKNGLVAREPPRQVSGVAQRRRRSIIATSRPCASQGVAYRRSSLSAFSRRNAANIFRHRHDGGLYITPAANRMDSGSDAGTI
jgi:hypothetical protein